MAGLIVFLEVFNEYLQFSLKVLFLFCLRKEQNEQWHEISNNMVCATSKGSDQPVHMRSLIRAYPGRLNILGVFSYWPNIIWSF